MVPDANAAEQRGAHIGRPLRDQFGVGAMPAPRHAVGHHGGKQALDSAEKREGQRSRQHLRHLVDRQYRQAGRRQRLRDAAKTRADRLDRQAKKPGENCRQADRDQKRRPVRPEAAHGENGGDRRERDRHG